VHFALCPFCIIYYFYFQEAFQAFHPSTKLVSKYMPGLHIGKLSPDEVVKDEDMKKDFIELRKTAEQMVCDGRVFFCRLLTFCRHTPMFIA